MSCEESELEVKGAQFALIHDTVGYCLEIFCTQVICSIIKMKRQALFPIFKQKQQKTTDVQNEDTTRVATTSQIPSNSSRTEVSQISEKKVTLRQLKNIKGCQNVGPINSLNILRNSVRG